MTTSWSHASRGRLAAAAACNGAGLFTFVVAVLVSSAALAASATGRGIAVSRPFELAAACGGAVLLVVLLDWLRRLAL